MRRRDGGEEWYRAVPAMGAVGRIHVALVVVVAPLLVFAQDLSLAVQVPETFARKSATHVVMPLYPPEAVANGIQGVSVAVVRIGRDGKVVQIRILESPDDAIAAAVRGAVQQWGFAPVQVRKGDERETVIANTKLTFYFRIADGKGNVTSPEFSMPGVIGTGRVVDVGQAAFEKMLTETTEVMLVDIRDRDEYRLGHRSNAVNIPADELQARAQELTRPNRRVRLFGSG